MEERLNKSKVSSMFQPNLPAITHHLQATLSVQFICCMWLTNLLTVISFCASFVYAKAVRITEQLLICGGGVTVRSMQHLTYSGYGFTTERSNIHHS